MSDTSEAPVPPPVPPLEPGPAQPAPSVLRSPWVFVSVLLAPALLTLLTARLSDVCVPIALIGSLIAGLFCGFWTSLRVCKDPISQTFAGLAFAVVFMAVSFVACCAGCVAGGAKIAG